MAFNSGIHAHLLELGFTCELIPADWEDVGTVESGPYLTGGPAWEEYRMDDLLIHVDHNGSVDVEFLDLELERYLDEIHNQYAGT